MSYESEVLADSPAAYYRLGEPSGTTMLDTTGGASGTYGATVVLAQTGLVPTSTNTAALFPGTTATMTSMATIPARGAAIALPFSIEAWVNLDASVPAQHHAVFSCSDAAAQVASSGTNRGGLVARRNSAGNRISWWDSADSWMETTTTLTAGTAYHLVVAHVGTSIKFYVNGSVVHTGTRVGTFPTTGLVYTGIGGAIYTGADRLKGILDEVAVYDAELSAARVAAHYTAGTVATAGAGRMALLGVGA